MEKKQQIRSIVARVALPPTQTYYTPKRKTKKKCSVCGEPVKNYRTRFCEVHLEDYKFNRYRDKTLGEYQSKDSVKDKHPSWVNAHVRSFARSWNKILTSLPCAVCGYDKHVELAHIKAVSEFNVSDKLSDINNERNIIQLCRNCHWEFDNGYRDDIVLQSKHLDKDFT